MFVRMLAATFAMTLPVPSEAQVPPPPSMPGQDALGKNLVRVIQAKDALSDTVLVFEGGKEVARNKAEWLSIFGRKLSAEGVSFKVAPGFSSAGRLLFIEYFNSAGSWGREVPAQCCWSYDAVACDVADGKVTVIRCLRGGDRRLNEHGAPTR